MVGYDVSVTVTMRSSPRPHELEVLADQFEAVEHDPGSTTVKIIEHVAVSDEADAVAFVESMGTRPLDAGGLAMAHALEWAGILLVGVARNGAGFDIALGTHVP